MSGNVVLIAEDFEHQHDELITKLNTLGVKTKICLNTALTLEIAILKENPSVTVFNSSALGFESVKKLLHNIKLAGMTPVYYNIYTYEDSETLFELEKIGVGININQMYNMDAAAGHIKVISDNSPVDINEFKNKMHKRTVDILKELTMTSRQHGREYIAQSVMYILFNNHIRTNFYGEIYPAVAQIMDTTADCVEHSIRIAIDKCWKNTDQNVKIKYFPAAMLSEKKPTNSQFIVTVAEYVRNENIEEFVRAKRTQIKENNCN